ncbi:MAG: hypothetical protein R3C19_22795 [Planctomycetaceae bacterium]
MSQVDHSVNIRQAAEAAAAFLADVYKDQQFSNILLEEVERDTNDNWRITLGFDRPYRAGDLLMPDPAASLLRPRSTRDYKVFCIDRQTGEVQSMKLRDE